MQFLQKRSVHYEFCGAFTKTKDPLCFPDSESSIMHLLLSVMLFFHYLEGILSIISLLYL